MFSTTKNSTLFGGGVATTAFGGGNNQGVPASTGAGQLFGQTQNNGQTGTAQLFGETQNNGQNGSTGVFQPKPASECSGANSSSFQARGSLFQTTASNQSLFQGSSQPAQSSPELTQIKQTLENLVKEVAALSGRINDASIKKSDTNDGIYVACSLHCHILKETTMASAASSLQYTTGFTCDVCQRTSQDTNEKFYQCSACPSRTGGGHFDVCVTCIRKQLAP